MRNKTLLIIFFSFTIVTLQLLGLLVHTREYKKMYIIVARLQILQDQFLISLTHLALLRLPMPDTMWCWRSKQQFRLHRRNHRRVQCGEVLLLPTLLLLCAISRLLLSVIGCLVMRLRITSSSLWKNQLGLLQRLTFLWFYM